MSTRPMTLARVSRTSRGTQAEWLSELRRPPLRCSPASAPELLRRRPGTCIGRRYRVWARGSGAPVDSEITAECPGSPSGSGTPRRSRNFTE
jgi:hypothetical protein